MADTVSAPRLDESTHEPAVTVAGRVRRRVRSLLASWGLAAEVVDDALMIVEELVANVLDHAGTRFRLVVELSGSVLRIGVRDWCDRIPLVQPFDPGATRGRGLQLVAALARQWGCQHHDRGKTVWAELAV
jgi:two-component sensor histidine kinase